jgi:hypothetical protein
VGEKQANIRCQKIVAVTTLQIHKQQLCLNMDYYPKALYLMWFDKWMKRIENVEVRWKLHMIKNDIFLHITPKKRFGTVLAKNDSFVLRLTFAHYANHWIHRYMRIASIASIHDFYQHRKNFKTSTTFTNTERIFSDEYIALRIAQY